MLRSSVKILRFKIGDTIICGLTHNSDTNEYLIEKPMQISMLPIVGKKGVQSMSIYMQEWLEYAKETVFKIPADVVMLIATPEDEMAEEYMDALEKNELHRIQRDFEKISKNYGEEDSEIGDNPSNIGYNNEQYDTEYEEEDYDEDDFEEEKPD
jgi:hypothetical protein